jgi:ATP phosphoribosyltransferase
MGIVEFRIAVAKGRILEQVQPLWPRFGWQWPFSLDSRLLATEPLADQPGIILMKGEDVPVLVERGIAELGIVGKDILEEHPAQVLEVADLGIGRCRLVLAGRTAEPPRGQVRIATRYPSLTRAWAQAANLTAEVVALHGSVELAPIIGLAPYLVDLVQTGTTLKEHGLVEIETLRHISARLIANPALWRMKDLYRVRDAMREALQACPDITATAAGHG